VGWFLNFLFEDIKRPFVDPARLPEDRIPIDKTGKPDLSGYDEPSLRLLPDAVTVRRSLR